MIKFRVIGPIPDELKVIHRSPTEKALGTCNVNDIMTKPTSHIVDLVVYNIGNGAFQYSSSVAYLQTGHQSRGRG